MNRRTFCPYELSSVWYIVNKQTIRRIVLDHYQRTYMNLAEYFEKKTPNGRTRISRSMRIDGPILFWVGCVIYMMPSWRTAGTDAIVKDSLIIWPEGQWDPLKTILWEGDNTQTDRQTSRLYERIGLRANSLKTLKEHVKVFCEYICNLFSIVFHWYDPVITQRTFRFEQKTEAKVSDIMVDQKYNLKSHTSITLPQHSSLQNMLA